MAFASLVVRETEVPFIMTHWLALQVAEVEKFPLESTSRVAALIFVEVALPTNVKTRYEASAAR